MRKAVLVFCLVLSIGLQGVARAGQILGCDRSGGAGHSVLHADGVAHHHDDDGSIHKDTSKQSLDHVKADCCVHVVGVLLDSGSHVPQEPADSPVGQVPADGHDSPFLEGLKRPPR